MPDNITLFLESREGFYYYYNWTASQKNKIHWCECGHCNYGSGKRREQLPGLHGVWVGPFINLEDADRFVGQVLGAQVNHCNCINH